MKIKYLFKGIIKNIPGIEYFYEFNKSTGGTSSARYCYSVWLRHLIFAYQSGLTSIPKVIAELGPGDSLGTGIAGIISGAEKYYALDVKIYSNVEVNLKMFDDLVVLFKEKSPIPDQSEFPGLRPLLGSYNFPDHIFNDQYLKEILIESRLLRIRTSIELMHNSKIQDQIIEYKVPWNENANLKNDSVDMIFSQAVLQAVDNLEYTYKRMWELLKPNGLQSHDIGFKSCGSADSWFGHWKYTDLEWKIVRGRKSFYINREPYSSHSKLLKNNNFQILYEQKQYAESKINRKNLPPRFRHITNEDLTTYSVFLQARKISSK